MKHSAAIPEQRAAETCGIYVLRNLVNGKVYVGQSVHVAKRFAQHQKAARRGAKSHLYDAMRLYEGGSFVCEVLEECDPTSLDEREAFWIERLESRDPSKGYNFMPAGQRGRVMDEAMRGRLNITNTSAGALTIRQNTTGVIVATVAAGATNNVFFNTYSFTDVTVVPAVDGSSQTFTINTLQQIAGNHATQATAASRPTLRQDASGYYYLEFDGVDDSLATGSVDFSATDKMTVWAGVNKQSDAAVGVVCELGTSLANDIRLTAPRGNPGGSANYGFQSSGASTANAQSPDNYAAPNASVLCGIGNISGDSAVLRVNGAQVASDSADQGAGNYQNAPIYIGRRGGSSLPFNGRLYSLIVRGAASSASQITQAERYVASKMGITGL